MSILQAYCNRCASKAGANGHECDRCAALPHVPLLPSKVRAHRHTCACPNPACRMKVIYTTGSQLELCPLCDTEFISMDEGEEVSV